MTLLFLDEARALLLADLDPVEAETSRSSNAAPHARRRRLAAPTSPPIPCPPWWLCSDIRRREHGPALTVIGEAPAGAPFDGSVVPGTAVKIATGGVVPLGADRIVVQEIVEREGDRIRITEDRLAHARPGAGCDFRDGDICSVPARR